MNRLTDKIDSIAELSGFASFSDLLADYNPESLDGDYSLSMKIFTFIREETASFTDQDYDDLTLFMSLVANWTDEELDEFLATFTE